MSNRILEMMQQLASDANRSRRQFLLMLPPFTKNAETTEQVTSCDGTFENGSHRRIHGRTTILDVKLTMMEQPGGSSKGPLSRNGNLLAVCCGFMENVCSSYFQTFAEADNLYLVAGSGKTILWYISFLLFSFLVLNHRTSSTIIEYIDGMRKSGLASLAFYYFDFRDVEKKDRRGLLSSLIFQLCDQSDAYCDILSGVYSTHRDGSQNPSDTALTQCINDLLDCPGQAPVYLVLDALDECPNSFGTPSPREKVLQFVEDLVDLQLPNLRICLTSRPEIDIKAVLGPLKFHPISLHDEGGQQQDILNYIRSVIHSDPKTRRWRAEDKELVINELSEKANGMWVTDSMMLSSTH